MFIWPLASALRKSAGSGRCVSRVGDAAQALPVLKSATGAEDHYLAASAYLLLHRLIEVGTNGLKFTKAGL